MGDSVSHCRQGIVELTHADIAVIRKKSCFYKTEPVGFRNQDWFTNCVIKIGSDLAPEELFQQLKRIERKTGRKEEVIRFGPRVLDLDILFYDDVIMDTPLLKIPHPRMHQRRFVLIPFCDIDPQKMHPVLKKDMASLLNELYDPDQKVIRIPCDC